MRWVQGLSHGGKVVRGLAEARLQLLVLHLEPAYFLPRLDELRAQPVQLPAVPHWHLDVGGWLGGCHVRRSRPRHCRRRASRRALRCRGLLLLIQCLRGRHRQRVDVSHLSLCLSLSVRFLLFRYVVVVSRAVNMQRPRSVSPSSVASSENHRGVGTLRRRPPSPSPSSVRVLCSSNSPPTKVDAVAPQVLLSPTLPHTAVLPVTSRV
mmetsp:Transcript_35376/g.76842  ORF Transcript_35376/g.76842 Transcript_35376/m.76842 type:complete len:208 (-) Transcript_35376:129-752(-)